MGKVDLQYITDAKSYKYLSVIQLMSAPFQGWEIEWEGNRRADRQGDLVISFLSVTSFYEDVACGSRTLPISSPVYQSLEVALPPTA